MPRSAGPWSKLKGRCFLSHAYADQLAVKKLRDRMAGTRAKLVIFDKAKPDPTNPVSNGIVPDILSCQSLIYLEGGRSASSFWVTFERDYALRSGLDVYAYDPLQDSLRADHSKPLSLDVQTFHHQEDGDRVDSLFQWMREQRNFELDPQISRLRIGAMSGDTAVQLEQQIAKGGVVLYLCGAASAETVRQVYDPGFGSHLRRSVDFQKNFLDYRMAEFADTRDPDEASQFPYCDADFYAAADPYEYLCGVYARIDPELRPDWSPPGSSIIDLLSGARKGAFNWNRVDDLIVQLYAAVLAYAHKQAVSPPRSRALLEKDLGRLSFQWLDKGPAERIRLGSSFQEASPWKLGLMDAQDLVDRAAAQLTQSFGGPPARVDAATDPDLPFDKGFPAHFAYVWNWYPSFVELSMDIEGSGANVFVRRYPVPKHMRRNAKKAFDEKLASVMPH